MKDNLRVLIAWISDLIIVACRPISSPIWWNVLLGLFIKFHQRAAASLLLHAKSLFLFFFFFTLISLLLYLKLLISLYVSSLLFELTEDELCIIDKPKHVIHHFSQSISSLVRGIWYQSVCIKSRTRWIWWDIGKRRKIQRFRILNSKGSERG